MNQYIDRIIELAQYSYNMNEVPVGAIIVENNEIIGYGYNTRHSENSIIGHAEINAIEMACKYKKNWRLNECEIYVTLKPCMMCTGAIIESRINKINYICDRTNVRFKAEQYISLNKVGTSEQEDKYLKMLQLFFENKRN